MSVPVGTRIGPYEVTAQLGVGGMGEVYRARDTKLNRTVAIKALHASVAADRDRVARFEREAQLLASLHHPNIAGIYGLETADGQAYLVLEFVDGKPLDVVIKETGAMAAHDAVPLARQIADAIVAAHEKGIIHRDLKPANVMVTADGQVKVLDFGLGKSLDEGDKGAEGAAAAHSPTITLGATQGGIILGTAGYMSPEQAKGRAADRRSDVWSFGCLLFEMLAGARAFEGEDVTDTIAAIVRGDPNWQALPASTPPALRQLLQRTLIKERAERLTDMSVVRYILNEPNILTPAAQGVTPPHGSAPAQSPRSWIIATVVLSLAAIGLAIAYVTKDRSAVTTSGNPAHFTIVLPDDIEVTNINMAPLAIAPNGQTVAFAGLRAGRAQLFVNDLSTGVTKPLDGTDDARSPFFSPDGRWIGFFARGKLKKVTVSGASLQEIANAADARGGAWAVDDVIYYAPTNTSGLWKVSASGGDVTELTKPDPNTSETSHRNPHVLPDGKALLFQVWTGPGSNEHRIEYLSLTDGKRQVVVQNADGPVAVVNGRIVYSGSQDALLSAPWNPAQPGLQRVEPDALPFYAPIDNEGASAYAVAQNGTVVRLMGAPDRRLARIVWIDKAGKTEPLPLPDRDYVSAAISPDGTRAAIHSRGATEEIWIHDFRTKSFTPLMTPGGSSQAPVWTADSKYIVYRGTREGFRNIFQKPADGGGTEERVTSKADGLQTPTSTTADGRWMVYLQSGGPNAGDLWRISLDGRRESVRMIATPGDEVGGQVSPDGRWLAFEAEFSGRREVWVQPFAIAADQERAPRQQISRDGGLAARWSHDGRELYFMTPEALMAVTLKGDTFSPPRVLFHGRYRLPANANTNYDVARDGRFLHVLPIQPAKAHTRIEVLLNGIGASAR
jgi:eukaryotic-like serine/threonine-protein kinase